MRHFATLSVLVLLVATQAHALVLARGGQVTATVVLADGAPLPDQTAAHEVADHLAQITGGKVAVVAEKQAPTAGTRIFVGATQGLAKLGVNPAKLASEEWLVRTVGNDLYLVGGGPRGTLYAAYHFLEDGLQVHWWTPWEETVPRRPSLTLGPLNLHGQPGFRYRDIYMLYGHDGGRFAARNRLNREGDAPIDAKYGGTLAYGPPYHVHTFFLYFPPKENFAAHPDWYSLIGGKRVGDGAQLCLTNPELRQAFLAKLLQYIETSWAAAKAASLPPPLVFSVSQNDWNKACQCEKCQALAKAEGSEAGPLIDFVNYMADGVRDKYPEVFIDTLAYFYTQKAPLTLKPRDNVIIRLCDTEADMIKPITAPENRAFAEHILSWARIAKNLRIWDYAVTYATPNGMPLPTTHTYGPDYRFYAAHHVEGVFTELEYGILADLRDFKIWSMIKTLENPNVDYEQLTDTFMNGYYGPAGPSVKKYLRVLEAEAVTRKGSSTCWQGSPLRLTYLNLGFMQQAQRLFDQAEGAVAGDPIRLRRVRFARLSLDRATIAAYSKFVGEWLSQGGDPERFPLDREAIGQRALNTWYEQIDFRLPEKERATARLMAEGEIKRFAMVPGSIGLPEKFRDRPRGTIYDYTALMTRNHANVVKVVKDPEAESGITNRLELTAADVTNPEKYVLPMPWGLYGTVDKRFINGTPIKAEDIPGPGYHWYKMGTFPVAPAYYMYFFWSWIIQLDIDNAFDATKPNQKFEFWARIKFEGPRFPHAQPGAKDAICVERVILAKTE
jgi:hypothetical protein